MILVLLSKTEFASLLTLSMTEFTSLLTLNGYTELRFEYYKFESVEVSRLIHGFIPPKILGEGAEFF